MGGRRTLVEKPGLEERGRFRDRVVSRPYRGGRERIVKSGVSQKGTWLHRLAVRLLTVVLAVLVFWVLDFLVGDIRTIRGPDFASIEKVHIAPDLIAHRDELARRISDVARRIESATEKQRIVGDSSRNLQQTITQLLELRKLGIQKSATVSEAEQENVSTGLNVFLENQRRYQELGQDVSDLIERRQSLIAEKEETERKIGAQRAPAQEEYDALMQAHRMKLALLQLALLLPVLAVAAYVILGKRSGIYFPVSLAFGAATLVMIARVVHEYFPSRLFKYIFVGGLVIVVTRILVHFIRTIAFPKAQWIIRQYREGYERFLCPVCDYPIRVGPRRFLFWTRRTVNRAVVPDERSAQEEPYVCPSCGSVLFDECPSCHGIRHALLPYCIHCGASKEVAERAEDGCGGT